jgi:hypothetical protein
MMDGKLTILALSHMGPENASRALAPTFDANKYMRYENDGIITWKASDSLTLVTELNWIRDDFLGILRSGKPSPANGYGAAQYVAYTMSDTVTFNLRGEVWRDDTGAFVTSFTGNNDAVRSELGLTPLSTVFSTAPKATTYGEITVGFTFKPALPAPVTGLLIRPELRVDSALGGGHPFNGGTNATQLTLASDFVLTF